MQHVYRLRFIVWLFVFLLCGCDTNSEVTDEKELSFGELIEQTHFVAKELHFNMQSGSDQQLNASVFEAFKKQLDEISANASASDLSAKKQSDLIDACNSLKQNFQYVISGSDDYHRRFSKVDTRLMREIEILASMKER